jgi:hypothetical protein
VEVPVPGKSITKKSAETAEPAARPAKSSVTRQQLEQAAKLRSDG